MSADNKSPLEILKLQARSLGERTPFCPDDETIAIFFERDLPQNQRQAVTRHLSDCRFCRGRVGLLMRLQELTDDQLVSEDLKARAKQLGASKPGSKWKQAPVWAAAATILLAVGVWIGQSPRLATLVMPPGEVRELRSIDSTVPEPRILFPIAGSRINPANLQIRWTPVAGSLHYQLYVMNDAGDLLVQEKTDDTMWQAAAPLSLKPGQEFFVRVDAHLEDASTVSTNHVIYSAEGSD